MYGMLCAAAIGVAIGVVAARSAYRNGFRDGAMWMHQGESYPSKPPGEWKLWGSLRRSVGRG